MPFSADALDLRDEDRKELESWVRSSALRQDLAIRARIVLSLASGRSTQATAELVGTSANTVSMWRRRFVREGTQGLVSRKSPGRPKSISAAKERRVVAETMRPPEGSTHWSAVRLSRKVGMSKATVQRIWKKYGLQPHRHTTFKFSTDPAFDEKLEDVVGLYLDPPNGALVLCVDEKSQIQALDRTQLELPLRPGRPASRTHDYRRHGTTSLFAALNLKTGKVDGRCFARHTHEEFLAFLKHLAKAHRRRDLHIIVDNYGTHTHPNVQNWLAQHSRVQLHFTPTSASWLNLVERWFGILTDQAIRRGSFASVRDLEQRIKRFIEHWNEHGQPFVWTKSANEIRRKMRKF
jgi:transposase